MAEPFPLLISLLGAGPSVGPVALWEAELGDWHQITEAELWPVAHAITPANALEDGSGRAEVAGILIEHDVRVDGVFEFLVDEVAALLLGLDWLEQDLVHRVLGV